ncbi:cysteine--tRNA ligase [Patescibacteria group bacterium]|nr:cysteine--tRNA ligase [Patescibacteria group bacterium]
MAFKIYNTLHSRKEVFSPLKDNEVRMYVCGVTLYDELHLGHARAAVVFDVIRNYLEYKGYRVNYVTNFTDVDDKMIERAKKLGITIFDLAEKFIEKYFDQMGQLRIRRANHHPRATQHVEEIINLIKLLEKRGFAYSVNGDIFFRVKKFPDYGKLSHQSLEELLAGVRIEVNEKKEDPFDFALWKKAKRGEPSWESPWGKGRPGWHIECSSMAMKYLGESIDIHGGGQDLVFPHHENEIAQSEVATGKIFANFWIHNGLVTMNREKMAKSTGNFITLDGALKKCPGEVIRYFLLSSHYRSPLDYSENSLREASSSLNRVYTLLDKIEEETEDINILKKEKIPPRIPVTPEFEVLSDKFIGAMDDDFNTPIALSTIFDMVRQANLILNEPLSKSSRLVLLEVGGKIKKLGSILGLFQRKGKDLNQKTEKLLNILIELRDRLRKERKWDLADEIRKKLEDIGIKLEDKKEGTKWRTEDI